MLMRPHVFERGDRIYLTTPLTIVSPSDSEISEYAFASSVKTKAPNDNIGWVQGSYVEAGKANLNGAMWLSDELALKSLTPMLMPVTVMHDPRTAVGTIADCKLQSGDSATSHIDTILAIWAHRFPEVWAETESNVERGEMMQSMECFAPDYACSECGQQYVKLPKGAEKSSWCSHLVQGEGSRILRNVCFTGTGLIFGSRGARGAYTEAHLEPFENEIAEFHERAHVDSGYRPSERRASQMSLVQIEDSELATLRAERDAAKAKVEELSTANRDLTTKLETAEAATLTEKTAKETAEAKVKTLEETAQRSTLKDKRIETLGDGFLAKLGEFTRGRLTEAAASLSDEDWESALQEKEEMAGVKRDAKKDPADPAKPDPAATSPEAAAFSTEEVANFLTRGVTKPATATSEGAADGTLATRKLVAAFAPPSKTEGDK